MTEDVMLQPFREAAAKELENLIEDLYRVLNNETRTGVRKGIWKAIASARKRQDKLMPEWADADELRGRAARNDLGCFQL